MKALLLEDDPIIAWHISTTLKKLNFSQIKIIDCIKDVFVNQETSQYDLIVSNLKLDDGWLDQSFFSKITYENSNLIIVTGLSDTKTRYVDYDNSDIVTLYKPFSPSQLNNTLRNKFSIGG